MSQQAKYALTLVSADLMNVVIRPSFNGGIDVMKKYQAFWPLPGGTEKFVDTLQRCLYFIKDSRPPRQQLTDWFFQNFEKVASKESIRGYITLALWHSGLVEHDETGHSLTEAGREYLENPDNIRLFKTLDENVRGFRESLNIISRKEPDLEELRKELSKLGLRWKKLNQPRYRVQWLRSMGFVSSEGPKLRLTPAGAKLLGKKKLAASRAAGSLQPRQVRCRMERISHEYQGKEESPQHKRLMSFLRENPDRLEKGMRFKQEEYLFPTNDSIDLVFRDKRSRYVVVEVEVRVPKGRIAGLLQAIKYKYMLAVSLKLDFRDVRSILAATEIHPSVIAWCKEYDVEAKTISDN